MSNHSIQKLDELINDLSLNKAEIQYLQWKSEVQNVAKGDNDIFLLHANQKFPSVIFYK